MLAADEGLLEANTLKVLRLCRADVEQAAACGRTGPLLHSIAASMSTAGKVDVRVNEGHNSLIRACCERARHIGLPLLSTRCNIKKELNIGTRGANSRWQRLRPVCAGVLEDCLNHYSAAFTSVLSDSSRWAPPELEVPWPTAAQMDSVPSGLVERPVEDLAWATKVNLLWHKEFGTVSARCCMLVGKGHAELAAGDVVYIVSDKSYSMGVLTACVVYGREGGLAARIADPLVQVQSVELFADWFAKVGYDNVLTVAKIPMSWTCLGGNLCADLLDGEEAHTIDLQVRKPKRREAKPEAAADNPDGRPRPGRLDGLVRRIRARARAGERVGESADSNEEANPSEEEQVLRQLALGNIDGADIDLESEDGWVRALLEALAEGTVDEVNDDNDESTEQMRQQIGEEEVRNHEDTVMSRSRRLNCGQPDSTSLGPSVADDVEDIDEAVREADLAASAFDGLGADPDPPGESDVVDLPCSTESAYEAAVQTWHDNVSLSLEILLDRAVACQSTPAGGEWPWQISLIKFSEEHDGCVHHVVEFVAWTAPTSMRGRRVSIRDGRIVAVVPARVREECFRDCEVIHPAVGERPHKCGRGDRPEMPSPMLRLKHMWEVALAAATSQEPCLLLADCSICHFPDLGQEDGDASAKGVWQCALCLLSFHESCCQALAAQLRHLPSRRPAQLQLLPAAFQAQGCDSRDPLCCLCRQLFDLCQSTGGGGLWTLFRVGAMKICIWSFFPSLSLFL